MSPTRADGSAVTSRFLVVTLTPAGRVKRGWEFDDESEARTRERQLRERGHRVSFRDLRPE